MVTSTSQLAAHQVVLGKLLQDANVVVELLDHAVVEGPSTEVFRVTWGMKRREDYGYLRLQVRAKSNLERLLRHFRVPVPQGRSLWLHRLVYSLCFRGPIPSTHQVHHEDLNPLNNRATNLLLPTIRQHLAIHKVEGWPGSAPDPGTLFLKVTYLRPVPEVMTPIQHGRQGLYGPRRPGRHSAGAPDADAALEPLTGTQPDTGRGSYLPHTDDADVMVAFGLEQTSDDRGRRRLRQARELTGFGLSGKALERAGALLQLVHEEGGFVAVTSLAASPALKTWSRSTLEGDLRRLVALGLLKRSKLGRYSLAEAAFIRQGKEG